MNTEVIQEYELIVGLEIHVQLNTLSKAFCADENRFGQEPNTLISPVSLAYPGTLPVPNLQHVDKAIGLGLYLGSRIGELVRFDRKNYVYPDLPKGYQITQDSNPICIGGEINLSTSGSSIRIHHIHMEEDAGKLIHDQDPNLTLIDLNRAGVPLLEIVTEPDLRTPEEVYECIGVVQKIVRHLDISDGNMEEGSLRCDCNVSIRPKGSTLLGERCEIKNLNSRRFARMAVEYEFSRQKALVRQGHQITNQTLHYHREKNITYPLRTKEGAHDYRYFPDPDLPAIPITKQQIENIRNLLPDNLERINENLQKEYLISDEISRIITSSKESLNAFQQYISGYKPEYHKLFIDLFIHKIKPRIDQGNAEIPQSIVHELIFMIHKGQISRTSAFQVLFDQLISNPGKSASQLAHDLNILQSDVKEDLEVWIDEAIAKYPDKWEALSRGKKNLIGLFMGEVMKASRGKAHPQKVRAILESRCK